MRCLMCSGVNIPAPVGGDCRDWPGGVWGGVEWVDAADTFLERDVAVDWEAVETFCRLRGGAMGKVRFDVLVEGQIQFRGWISASKHPRILIGQLSQSNSRINPLCGIGRRVAICKAFRDDRDCGCATMKATSNLIGRILCRRCQHRAFSTLCSHPNRPGLRVIPSSAPYRLHRRLAGTKLRKSIEELPQGLQLPLEPFIEKEASKYSPVIDEVLQNQRRFPKCVLLTRVGQFYEVCSWPWIRWKLVVFHSGRGDSSTAQYQTSFKTNEAWTDWYGWVPILPTWSIPQNSSRRTSEVRGLMRRIS